MWYNIIYNFFILKQSSPQVYATERLKAGLSPDAIKQNLLAVGWSEEEANTAIVGGLIALGVPVPPNGARTGHGRLSSTVEVVLNFFSFIALGVAKFPIPVTNEGFIKTTNLSLSPFVILSLRFAHRSI